MVNSSYSYHLLNPLPLKSVITLAIKCQDEFWRGQTFKMEQNYINNYWKQQPQLNDKIKILNFKKKYKMYIVPKSILQFF